MRSPLAAAFLVLGACAPTLPTVSRTLQGERSVGVFVSPFAYEHFVRAELAVAAGDDAAAVELYQLARAGAQDDAYVAARQAEALIRLQRYQAAEATLAEAEAIEPATEELWLARGALRITRGDREGAMEAFVEASRIAPRSPEPILRIARQLQEGGEAARALELLSTGETPAALRAAFALAIAREDSLTASEAATELALHLPLALPEVVAAARAALGSGQPILAARLLSHPAIEDATDAVPLRVRALVALGEDEAAEALVLASSSEDVGGRGVQARLLLEAGRPEIARDVAAIGLSLGEAGSAAALGWALLEVDGPGKAAAAFAAEVSEPSDAPRGTARALELAGLPALSAEIASARRD